MIEVMARVLDSFMKLKRIFPQIRYTGKFSIPLLNMLEKTTTITSMDSSGFSTLQI